MSLTTEQLAQRKSGIGASEISAVVGLSPWDSPLDLYMKKLGLTQPKDKPWKQWGNILEPVVAQVVAEQRGWTITKGTDTIAHPRYPIALATPDFYIAELPEELLEIKTSREASEWGAEGTDEIPACYLTQCQWQMFVLARKTVHLAALINQSTLKTFVVRYDDEFVHFLFDAATQFWEQHVLKRVPPAPSSGDDARSYIHSVFKMGNGKIIPASPEIVSLARQLDQVKRDEKALKETKTSIENKIKLWIGDNDGCEFPEGKITWKFQRGSTYQVTKPDGRVMRCSGALFKGDGE